MYYVDMDRGYLKILKNSDFEISTKDLYCINKYFTVLMQNMMRDGEPLTLIYDVASSLNEINFRYFTEYIEKYQKPSRLRGIKNTFLRAYYTFTIDLRGASEHVYYLVNRLTDKNVISINKNR